MREGIKLQGSKPETRVLWLLVTLSYIILFVLQISATKSCAVQCCYFCSYVLLILFSRHYFLYVRPTPIAYLVVKVRMPTNNWGSVNKLRKICLRNMAEHPRHPVQDELCGGGSSGEQRGGPWLSTSAQKCAQLVSQLNHPFTRTAFGSVTNGIFWTWNLGPFFLTFWASTKWLAVTDFFKKKWFACRYYPHFLCLMSSGLGV